MHTDLSRLCILPGCTIRQAIKQLDASRLGLVMIVDAEQHLLGTITDGDVRRAILAGISLDSDISALQELKRNTPFVKPIVGSAGQSKSIYLKLMEQHKILHLPIIGQDQRVVGLVRRDDFLEQTFDVEALVMAGGIGSRLYPLTQQTPKPMLPVGDRPLMEIMIGQLRDAGIRRVHVAINHQKDKIVEHFKDGSHLNVEMSYLSETSPLGTAGALGLLEKSDKTILIMNGDILTNVDFRAMMAYHKENEADLTIAVRQYDVQVPYGIVECDGQKTLGIREKPIFNFFVNAGLYLLEPAMLDLLPEKGGRIDMTELIQHLLRENRVVRSFPILEQWIDIGQHQDYQEAQEAAKTWGTPQ
jgi:dTDP-glucose pyrophosphorylase/CBS domain-containing protein